MTWWKRLYMDYEESRSPEDDFLGWFLQRKLSFGGKMGCSYALWAGLIIMLLNPVSFLFAFYGLLALALVTIVQIVWNKMAKK